jgi:hypothetical protein
LNSHGTHSVPAQVIATLYTSSFSDRENVVAEGQEIAEIYNRHFPDAWYSMPENAIADADAAAAAIARSTVAIASNTAAGLPNTIASTDDTIASTDDTIADNCDDESDLGNDEDDPVADNCDDESDLDESYDATYDDEAGNEHYHSRQRRGRPDWGIQSPGWTAPRAPTAHPEARPPSSHRLQDWNVNVTAFSHRSGYTIENDDVIYRLPSAPGNTIRYHPPFVPGTLEHQLHRRPLAERLHVLHQLRDVLLTEEEENGIREQMNPVSESFSISISTQEIAVQTDRYENSQEREVYVETLRERSRDERPIARSRAWMRAQFLAEAADSIPLRSLPPLPPFIPFATRLVRRRRSI